MFEKNQPTIAIARPSNGQTSFVSDAVFRNFAAETPFEQRIGQLLSESIRKSGLTREQIEEVADLFGNEIIALSAVQQNEALYQLGVNLLFLERNNDDTYCKLRTYLPYLTF